MSKIKLVICPKGRNCSAYLCSHIGWHNPQGKYGIYCRAAPGNCPKCIEAKKTAYKLLTDDRQNYTI